MPSRLNPALLSALITILVCASGCAPTIQQPSSEPSASAEKQNALSAGDDEPPAWLTPYNVELHAMCDDWVVIKTFDMPSDTWKSDPHIAKMIDAEKAVWPLWSGFPYRWKICDGWVQQFCKGAREDYEVYRRLALKCHKAKGGDCSDIETLAKLNAPDPAACELIGKLDDLMKRFEAASQEANAQLQENLRTLSNPQPNPTFTNCTPSISGGFTCTNF